VVLLADESRHAFHGIDRILPGSSDLLPGGGRINLTLRRVTRPSGAGRAGSAPPHPAHSATRDQLGSGS
jgi:hypothetical protein